MASYMVTYHLPAANRNEAIHRFVGGSAMDAPPGITLIGRWHSAAGNLGWSIVETDDPKFITDWLLQWSDIITYDVAPVLSDEEYGDLFARHGLS